MHNLAGNEKMHQILRFFCVTNRQLRKRAYLQAGFQFLSSIRPTFNVTLEVQAENEKLRPPLFIVYCVSGQVQSIGQLLLLPTENVLFSSPFTNWSNGSDDTEPQ